MENKANIIKPIRPRVKEIEEKRARIRKALDKFQDMKYDNEESKKSLDTENEKNI